MVTHVKVIGILHIVFGALGVLGAIVAMMVFGGIAGIVGFNAHTNDAAVAVPILGVIGGFVFIVMMALSLPSLIVGFGLIRFRPWARMLAIVLSVLHLFNIPFGTALGVYGLWALLAPETEMLFRSQQAIPASYPPAYPRA